MRKGHGWRYILLSLIVAGVSQFLPIGGLLSPWRPVLPILIVAFWAYSVPDHFGVALGFIYGLVVETALGMDTLQLSLPCALVVLLVQYSVMRLRAYSVFQQSVTIAFFVVLAGLMVFPLSSLVWRNELIGAVLRSFVITMFLWCVLATWLAPFSRRYVTFGE